MDALANLLEWNVLVSAEKYTESEDFPQRPKAHQGSASTGAQRARGNKGHSSFTSERGYWQGQW